MGMKQAYGQGDSSRINEIKKKIKEFYSKKVII